MSVSAPLDVATIDLIAEGSESCCHWSISRFALDTSLQLVGHTNWKTFIQDKVKRRVSGPEKKTGKAKRATKVTKAAQKEMDN